MFLTECNFLPQNFGLHIPTAGHHFSPRISVRYFLLVTYLTEYPVTLLWSHNKTSEAPAVVGADGRSAMEDAISDGSRAAGGTRCMRVRSDRVSPDDGAHADATYGRRTGSGVVSGTPSCCSKNFVFLVTDFNYLSV